MAQRRIDKDRIADLYEQGRSVPQIQEELGCSRAVIYRAVKQKAVSLRQPPADHDQVVADYQSGLTVKATAERQGITTTTVYNVLRDRGIPRRRRVTRHHREFSAAEKTRMEDLRRSGWAKMELMDEFHCGLDPVNRVLGELGLAAPMKRRDAKYARRTLGGYTAVYVPPDDPMRVMAWTGKCYVLEHRLVMARHHGRPLRSDESVHHINGDRLDNRLANLQLRQGKHGSGVCMVCQDCGSSNVGYVHIVDGQPPLFIAAS